VLVLALRPFLARCAEALSPQVDLGSWNHGHCPICGWETDFAVITPGADRRLFCGRCVAQWAFAPLTCPFCANDDRALITSFATRDGRYLIQKDTLADTSTHVVLQRIRFVPLAGSLATAARRGGHAAGVYGMKMADG
jgi:formate dehydrogenase maturation protein FdhE